MATTLQPEEILIGIMKLGSFKEFSASTTRLHRLLYKLRQEADFSEMLRPFKFAGSPAAPFSEVLYGALFNLQFGNKLRRFNPELVVYQTTEGADKYFTEIIQPKLTEKSKKILENIASKLKSL
jgi:hypothetical protein